ncbi:MAG: ribonuclease III [Desulfuromonadales bacterium]|nr:ribonuclease III [Desulfuromonadales bacterium]
MEARVQSTWNALEQRIGHHFLDRELLARALTHRSYANECRNQPFGDNERLEFLGDAVLDLIVGHRLYMLHAEADEGELSRLRAELVSTPSLAGLARELVLGECLLLGRGEDRSGGRDRESLHADSLEAVIGAVFLDAGYGAAEAVVSRLFAPLLQAAQVGRDCKTRLQELLQARRQQRPEYLLTASHGPDHQRRYEVEVLAAGSVLGRGEGTTKKRAEQEAARCALEHLEGEGRTSDD